MSVLRGIDYILGDLNNASSRIELLNPTIRLISLFMAHVMNQFHISVVAHLIAEPVRSIMLINLAGGEALSASALARAASVTAQTASFHLAKLRDGGLISVESVGRYRYYRLAGPHISQLLENLALVGTVSQQWKTIPSSLARELRFARCCYDHLAGQIGVAITQGMLNRGLFAIGESQRYVLTDSGHHWLEQQGIEIPEEWEGNHRMCLDWTERQYHLAGPLGFALLDAFISWKWLSRLGKSRALKITPSGWKAFGHHFGIRQLHGKPTAD